MPLFQSPTLMTEMKLKSDYVHNRDDQRWDSNSSHAWWSITCLVTFGLSPNSWSLSRSRHLLSVIITTFLEYTWCVVSSNKMRILTRSVYSENSEKTCSFCCLGSLARTAYLPWLSWWSPTENVTTKWLTKSCKNVTKHVMVAPTVWVSPLIMIMIHDSSI